MYKWKKGEFKSFLVDIFIVLTLVLLMFIFNVPNPLDIIDSFVGFLFIFIVFSIGGLITFIGGLFK